MYDGLMMMMHKLSHKVLLYFVTWTDDDDGGVGVSIRSYFTEGDDDDNISIKLKGKHEESKNGGCVSNLAKWQITVIRGGSHLRDAHDCCRSPR